MGRNDEIRIFNGIINGDDEVLKSFYKKNFKRIRNFVVMNSGTEVDSEDVFQDALIVLYQKLKSDPSSIHCSIHTFFYGVCKNIWRSKLRKKSNLPFIGDSDNLILDVNANIIEDIEKQERENLFRKHFLKLNNSCRQILTLYFEGKSVREIAMITKYSEGNVRKKKFESKKLLMSMIENDPLYREFVFQNKETKKVS
ncbi:RNA polymerase sigma factor [Aquimarina sp. RZ0]|uniref:RNA polymerase sigma factor n=1 Tax=Aquimarina sp. RZ0 TaxID=2607730 RepID=UPI0011F4010C|nr:sigma-70 family RNA polymerase sigma factor [Aquimarina sp. RZ0]KAA1243211.1 sigma-70 family RNA polymerase sigma factor [Aquimarina sp. RZ0]